MEAECRQLLWYVVTLRTATWRLVWFRAALLQLVQRPVASVTRIGIDVGNVVLCCLSACPAMAVVLCSRLSLAAGVCAPQIGPNTVVAYLRAPPTGSSAMFVFFFCMQVLLNDSIRRGFGRSDQCGCGGR
jgi:hypothetical protein